MDLTVFNARIYLYWIFVSTFHFPLPYNRWLDECDENFVLCSYFGQYYCSHSVLHGWHIRNTSLRAILWMAGSISSVHKRITGLPHFLFWHSVLDPSVVALLVCSMLSLIFTPFMWAWVIINRCSNLYIDNSFVVRLYTLYTEYIHRFLTTVAFEVFASALLWILWLASTAAATVRH